MSISNKPLKLTESLNHQVLFCISNMASRSLTTTDTWLFLISQLGYKKHLVIHALLQSLFTILLICKIKFEPSRNSYFLLAILKKLLSSRHSTKWLKNVKKSAACILLRKKSENNFICLKKMDKVSSLSVRKKNSKV